MNLQTKEPPHIDAVSGQAAWMVVQALAMELVKSKVIPKSTMRSHLDAAIHHARTGKDLNPAQRGAAYLLQMLHTNLQTADRSDSH